MPIDPKQSPQATTVLQIESPVFPMQLLGADAHTFRWSGKPGNAAAKPYWQDVLSPPVGTSLIVAALGRWSLSYNQGDHHVKYAGTSARLNYTAGVVTLRVSASWRDNNGDDVATFWVTVNVLYFGSPASTD